MVKQVANLDFVAKKEGDLLIKANEEFEMTLERSKEVQEKLRERANSGEIHNIYKTFEITRVEEVEESVETEVEKAEEKPKKTTKATKNGEDK